LFHWGIDRGGWCHFERKTHGAQHLKLPTGYKYLESWRDEERRDQRHAVCELSLLTLREEDILDVRRYCSIDWPELPPPKVVLEPIVIYCPDPDGFNPSYELQVAKQRELDREKDHVLMVSFDDYKPDEPPLFWGWIRVGEIYEHKLGAMKSKGPGASACRYIPMGDTHEPHELESFLKTVPLRHRDLKPRELLWQERWNR
jgi:hypothetical protein